MAKVITVRRVRRCLPSTHPLVKGRPLLSHCDYQCEGDEVLHDCHRRQGRRGVHGRPAEAVHRRTVDRCGVRQDVRDPEPGYRGNPRQRSRGRRRRHQPSRQRRPQGIRERSVEPHDTLGTRPAHLEDRRPHSRECRGARPAGVARQRQAGRRRARRGRAAGGGPVPLHGRLGHQDRGQHDRHLGAVHAGRQLPLLHAARAGWRRRPDHPVELPAADGRVEARPGPDHG